MKPFDVFANLVSGFPPVDRGSGIIDHYAQKAEGGYEYTVSLFRANGPPKVTFKDKYLFIFIPTDEGEVKLGSRIENPPDPGEITAKKKDGALHIFVPHPKEDSGGTEIPIE